MEKIIAAGGIVENEDAKILFQFRRGKWDLPKGKWDEGETIEECAVREVEEETGLKNINRKNLIGKTIHYYKENGKEIEKETYWYAMSIKGHQELIPQLEEGITALHWVGENEMQPYLSNTFDNIVDIVNQYYSTKKPTNEAGEF